MLGLLRPCYAIVQHQRHLANLGNLLASSTLGSSLADSSNAWCTGLEQSGRQIATSTSSSSSSSSASDSSSTSDNSSASDSSIMVLPMPSLSHAMTSGAVGRWLKSEGEKVNIYDLLAEVWTDNLVDEAYKVGDFAGRVTLLLESQEAGVLRKILVRPGQEVKVGTPIAIISEEEEEGKAGAAAAGSAVAAAYHGVATRDVYDPSQPPVRVLEWQSYLKEGSSPSSSCGCS